MTAPAAAPATTAPDDDRPTMADRVAEWGVTVEILSSRPGEREHLGKGRTTVHHLALRVQGSRGAVRTFPITMGSAHKGAPPEAPDVLSMYASDAQDGTKPFEEFLSDFVTDPDRATTAMYRKTWLLCRRIHGRMLALFGPERLDLLMYHTEYQ